VTDLPSGREPQPLSTLLPALAKVSPDDIRLVLPAPGDPRGLPGPGPFTTACLLSGEGIRCRSWGLIPELMTHRSGSGDIWHTVEWRYFVLPVPGPPTESLTLAEADHDLLAAVRGATETLRRLEVARWRPELGPALHGLRDPSGDADLPPGYPPRAAQVLRRAEAVTAIAELATTDAPGSAVTAAEAAGRDEALRPLATAARRAACAAYNAPLEC
jgi:hypothetical protein